MPRESVDDPEDAALIESLLAAAGRRTATWSSLRVGAATSTNRSYEVGVDGARFVARCYRWPYEGVDGLRRPTKEAWLSRYLSAAGVPVAEVVATVDDRRRPGVLLRLVEGEVLGDLAAAGTPRLHQAWEKAGAALRRAHDLDGPPGGAGVIVGDQLEPFDGGWPAWQAKNLRGHAVKLARRRGAAVPLDALLTLADAATQALARVPLSLLHNDPHAWNVLVARDGAEWRCAAWLDWEFAWVGDPAWDLARLDTFRMADIGPTPAAFYEGYGSHPSDAAYELYLLAINLWMVNQSDDGDDRLPVTYASARRYLDDLDVHVRQLRERLGV